MPKLQLVAHDDPRRGDPMMSDRRRSNPLDAYRDELDDFYAQMREFQNLEIDEIFMTLAGMSARASEIRGLLQRMQTKVATNMKCQEIDPFLSEVDRQFKDWSRAHQYRVDEWRISGGAT